MNKKNYQNYQNFKDWNKSDFGSLSNEDRVYFDGEFKQIHKGSISGKNILELGFGNGSFASWSTQNGCKYYGTELIEELVLMAQEHEFNVFDATKPLKEVIPKNSIDYIVAFDVFEHLSKEEIDFKLLECFEVLKNNGELIARVPSGDSPYSRSIQNGDFTHKISLGSSMIKQIAISNGYEVKEIRSPYTPISGLGLKSFIRRSIIKTFRSLIYPIISNILMGGGKPVLSPNILFILKVKK